MGRALLIITAGLLVALGYTFFGVSNTRQSMFQRNVNSYYTAKAKDTANSGIQVAVQMFNDNDEQPYSNKRITYDGADLNLSVNQVAAKTNVIKVTSESTYQGAKHTVIATFDISTKQTLVPPFIGALTKVGNQPIKFKTGNKKIHFNGIAPAGSGCSNKPGLTVPTSSEIDDYSYLEQIDGNPGVAKNDKIKMKDITDLVDALEDQATKVNDGSDFRSDPGVYLINDYTHLSGQTEGSGILIVKNDAILDVDAGVKLTGKFTFKGLVILENGSRLSGSGNAEIKGSVFAASNSIPTYIKPNGNFDTQYDCNQQKTANDAINGLLNTTIYKKLSIYE